MCSHKFMHGWHYFWEGKRGKHLIPIKTRHPPQGEAMQKNYSVPRFVPLWSRPMADTPGLGSLPFPPSLFTYAQLCLTLCNPMDCSPSGSSLHGIFQARILKQRCHFLLQGIFPTQGLNPRLLSLLHWQADSLPLHHLGSPFPLSRLGISKGFPGSCQPVSVRNLLYPDTHDWHLLPAVLAGSSCHLGQIYVDSLSVS